MPVAVRRGIPQVGWSKRSAGSLCFSSLRGSDCDAHPGLQADGPQRRDSSRLAPCTLEPDMRTCPLVPENPLALADASSPPGPSTRRDGASWHLDRPVWTRGFSLSAGRGARWCLVDHPVVPTPFVSQNDDPGRGVPFVNPSQCDLLIVLVSLALVNAPWTSPSSFGATPKTSLAIGPGLSLGSVPVACQLLASL